LEFFPHLNSNPKSSPNPNSSAMESNIKLLFEKLTRMVCDDIRKCFSEHVAQFAWDTATSTSCIDESVLPPPFVPARPGGRCRRRRRAPPLRRRRRRRRGSSTCDRHQRCRPRRARPHHQLLTTRKGLPRAQARRPLRLLRVGHHPAVPRRGPGPRRVHPRHRARRRALGAAPPGRDREHHQGGRIRSGQGAGAGAGSGAALRADLVDAPHDGPHPGAETLQVTDALANCSMKCLSGVNGLLLQYTPSPRMQQKDGGSRPPAAPDPQPVIYWAHLQPWATTYSSFMVTGGVASNVLYNLIRTDGGGRLFDSDIALLFQPWLLLGVSNEPFPKSYNGSFINISLPEGVQTAVPHGLLLTIPDYDSPAQLMKPLERNTRSVNAILTIPTGTLFLMCGMHLAFDCELIGRYDELWAYW
jgi:hypothetical protein